MSVHSHRKGLVLAGIPSFSNAYYNPFLNDIAAFHSVLAKETKRDAFFSLDYEATGYDDIWVRDIAPVVTSRLVKFIYRPQYLPREESQALDDAFRRWLESQGFSAYYSSLVLDGGNVAWNKGDAVILTDRVLLDNAPLSREEIIKQLRSDLRVERVILAPSEPGDILAHADGMVKFIAQDALFINDFLGDDAFRQRIEGTIMNQMPTVKFIVIKSGYTENEPYDARIASAKGLYINMLETEHAVFLPQFCLQEDAEMLRFVSGHVDKPVVPVNVERLSAMGGAVNCLTWYCPGRFLPSGMQSGLA